MWKLDEGGFIRSLPVEENFGYQYMNCRGDFNAYLSYIDLPALASSPLDGAYKEIILQKLAASYEGLTLFLHQADLIMTSLRGFWTR